MSKRNIQDFLDKEQKEYARYTIANRAIPNFIDGFKPVHRKIFYTALNHCKNKPLKTASLVGYTIAESNYNHGDAPAGSAINGMAQDFPGANNIPIFDGLGNFGDRFIPEAAAPRYTDVVLSKTALKFFIDFDIADENIDPENPEPQCYLPIIPWLFVNGISGIAVGFATAILPRDPKFLIKVVKEKLKKKRKFKYEEYVPYFKGFTGNIEYDPENNNWIMTGKAEWSDKKTLIVKELPIGITREKYIAHLEKLVERRLIRDYTDKSKETPNYEIEFFKNDYDDEKIITLLRLRTTLTENITVLDNENKLMEFDSPDEVIDLFIDYRIQKYALRIHNLKKEAEHQVELIDEKIKFIQMVYTKEINLMTTNKVDLIKYLKEKDFKWFKEILDTPIHKFTKDELEKLKEKKHELTSTIIPNIEMMTPEGEWLKNLDVNI